MEFLPNVRWRQLGLAVLLLTFVSITVWFRSFEVLFDLELLWNNWLIIFAYDWLLLAYVLLINAWYYQWLSFHTRIKLPLGMLFYVIIAIMMVTGFNSLFLQVAVISHVPNVLTLWNYWIFDYPFLFFPLFIYTVGIHYFPQLRILPPKKKLPAGTLLELWSTIRDPRILLQYLIVENGSPQDSDTLSVRWMDTVLFYHQTNGYIVYLWNGEKLVTGIGRSKVLGSSVGSWFVEIQRSVYINMLYVDRESWPSKKLKLHDLGAAKMKKECKEQIEARLQVSRRGREKVEDFLKYLQRAPIEGWTEEVNLNGN